MTRPRHPRVREFLESGVFDEVSSFSELEERITQLDSTQDRGDCFEVFAEALLATQSHYQATEVWPLNSVPARLATSLGLGPVSGVGVDGIFQTPLGEICGYQVKFRSGRPTLTFRELGTFFGITDRVATRVLITNSDAVAPQAEHGRANFYCIRGSDLDALEPSDFARLSAWLAGVPSVPGRKTPREDQLEAIESIASRLADQRRTTAVMACGTGKTLVSLWVAEKLRARSVVVFVPSLALLRQVLHEWLRNTLLTDLSYLAVCSDTSVTEEIDSIQIRQSELDFPVTTDPQTIRQFATATFSGTKFVFCTYQSSKVLRDAVCDLAPFDLGVFDEAHKTTGRRGRYAGIALEDENIPIARRLFITATPRHYPVQSATLEEERRPVFSMDSTETYGDICFEMPFRRAAKLGIICAFKVIVSVVTSEQVARELLLRSETVVDGSCVKAIQVANQLALKAAIAQVDARRVFTFHASVRSAKSFASDSAEGIRSHLPSFSAFHVNGEMSAAERERVLKDFASVDRGLVTNARCLTEGVDVPAVDMVAYMSPRRSKVDIVQAAGRCMRLQQERPEKTTGFIVLPLLVEVGTGETVEDALTRTGFEDIWHVLQALQEHDGLLAETIREMKIERGRLAGFDDSRFREHVEVLAAHVDLSILRNCVTARILDRVGESWDELYGQLLRFKDEHGHCLVPFDYDAAPSLGRWAINLRRPERQKYITERRRRLLDEIGFVWDVSDALWQDNVSALSTWLESHDLASLHGSNPPLYQWLTNARRRWREGVLNQQRVRQLQELGLSMSGVKDSYASVWLRQFARVKHFVKKNGQWPSKTLNAALAQWTSFQRSAYKDGTLPPDFVQMLESIGIEWDVSDDAAWQKRYQQLLDFKNQFGHCNVPLRYEANKTLGGWAVTQRMRAKNGELEEARRQLLLAAGFVFEFTDRWWQMHERLRSFKERFGHVRVPQTWKEDKQLAKWVARQRAMNQKGKLPDEKRRALDDLGFVWRITGKRRNSADLLKRQ